MRPQPELLTEACGDCCALKGRVRAPAANGTTAAEKNEMKQPVAAAVVVGILALTPWTAGAQSTVTDIVNFLVTNQTIPIEDAGSDRAAAEAARDTITRALIVNLTSVPIATSSSGFLYRLNPELGTVERATETFGGFFVERAFSPGHGRASF